MKNIAAYILLTIGGNAAPTAADVKALLATVEYVSPPSTPATRIMLLLFLGGR
jgi:ribosomal protein L12E/L44/L45/RPP1/RPP2